MATADPEEQEMKELMDKWDSENQVEDDVSDDGSVEDEPTGYDDMLEKFRRTVTVTNNSLDHVVLGVPDLDQAVDDFEALTGVRPLMVVSQNGLGTKSARIAFESCCFLELLGPDPKQSPSPTAEKLAKLPAGEFRPIHFAVRNSKADDMKSGVWSDLGLECDQVTMIAKDRGMPWKWDMYFLEGHDDAGLVPFFIHWGESIHAAGRLPIVGSMDKVTVRASGDSKVHDLLKGVDDLEVGSGDDILECTFTSSKGTHTFSNASPFGIAFPK